jgi:hypothetical protein
MRESSRVATNSVQEIHSSPQAIFHKTLNWQIRMAAAEQNCEFAAAEPLFRSGLLYPAINTFEVAM